MAQMIRLSQSHFVNADQIVGITFFEAMATIKLAVEHVRADGRGSDPALIGLDRAESQALLEWVARNT